MDDKIKCGTFLNPDEIPADVRARMDADGARARAEADATRLRLKNQELNRRATQAEAAVMQRANVDGVGGLGHAAARVAARTWRERAEKAETRASKMLGLLLRWWCAENADPLDMPRLQAETRAILDEAKEQQP